MANISHIEIFFHVCFPFGWLVSDRQQRNRGEEELCHMLDFFARLSILHKTKVVSIYFNTLALETVLKIVCTKWLTLSRWFYFPIKREKLILWMGVYIQLCDWTMKGWATQYSDKTRRSIKIFRVIRIPNNSDVSVDNTDAY